ncbi:MAG: hypothetical protein AAGB19_02460 [Cyanobacteria bacterium P01_F01_bin.3]
MVITNGDLTAFSGFKVGDYLALPKTPHTPAHEKTRGKASLGNLVVYPGFRETVLFGYALD